MTRREGDPNSPYEPSNKIGFSKLPENSPCRECPNFNNLLKIDETSMQVECETPDKRLRPIIIFSPNQRHGGYVKEGGDPCKNNEGYESFFEYYEDYAIKYGAPWRK